MILLRLSGELAIKGRATRRLFEQRLAYNLRQALRAVGSEAPVERTRERYYVRSGSKAALEALGRCFGVQSVALAEVTRVERLEEVVGLGVHRFRTQVAGKRFAVRARRVGGKARTPLSANAVERELGEALRPFAARVDLSHPEVCVRLELHGQRQLWIEREVAGPGGFPLGVGGHAVALLSGGFDSAVAAWQVLRRGVDLDFVFCNLGGGAHLLGTLAVARTLADRWCHGARPRLHAVDFEPIAREIRAKIEPRYWQVVLKRQMLRAAERVARERGGEAIVTGEALGQVSSQTLTNLGTISRDTELPVLRPLVGSNKDEIVRTAETIGTAELSAAIAEYCAMVPSKPATAARPEIVADQERTLDDAVLERALEARERFDLRGLRQTAHEDRSLAAEKIPPSAAVIDLRSKAAFAGWHYPGALRLDFDRALVAYRAFERGRPYVLYCEIGLKSAHLAECMRREGFDARHFPDGLRGVVRFAEHQQIAGPEWVRAEHQRKREAG